jgi:hypothetical protein
MADPLQQIIETTSAIVLKANHVTIDDSMIEKTAEEMSTDVWQRLNQRTKSDTDNSFSLNSAISNDGFVESLFVEWDNEQVHFRDFNDPDATAQYILVLSAMNFCFWPTPKQKHITLSSYGSGKLVEQNVNLSELADDEFEYFDLAGNLRDVLLRDRNAFNATNLLHCSEETLFGWFNGRQVPLASERARLIREVGVNLQRHFDGKASKLIESANKSVVKLVSLVTAFFPGFRDHAVYTLDGRQVFFYKRAQIFVADIGGAFQYKGLGEFTDFHRLTMFADYRVPQILRQYHILHYSTELADKIDSKQLIPSGSVEELEIRAATIQVVERLKHVLQKNHRIRCKSVEIDWLLWQRGEAKRHELLPHHRTFTIYY